MDLMQIETRDFGLINIKESSIITFKEPIFGFEEYTQYVLISDGNMGNGICWLQSIEEKAICFILINPLEVSKDYAPVVMQNVLFTLQAAPEDELDCWAIMVVGSDFKKSTANLKSPVLINHKMKCAMQVILDQDYPIRKTIFEPESEG